eukprot:11207480-Lingulodinium_polyedra.AAC.1
MDRAPARHAFAVAFVCQRVRFENQCRAVARDCVGVARGPRTRFGWASYHVEGLAQRVRCKEPQ